MQVGHTSTGSVTLCDISSHILKDRPDLKMQHGKSETYFQTGGRRAFSVVVDALVLCHADVLIQAPPQTSYDRPYPNP
jgi:hypothetical protein